LNDTTRDDFAERLLHWFDRHGRHDLPWQHPRSAYRVWLSEIMLQQTQVTTVIPYFQRFLERFPTLQTLAQGPIDDVLRLWAGLGYYARARNLHRAAQLLVEQFGGEFPRDREALQSVPGIGRSTAAAILSQAFGQREAILDGNVRRLLARHAGIEGWPGEPAVQRRMWTIAEGHLPETRMADYTQALMDLGATLCTSRKPACLMCPLQADCVALIQHRVQQLPTPKPKRARPTRRAHLLLALDDAGRLLLLRRPPSGLWGGLWTPVLVERAAPEDEGQDADAVESWRDLLESRHGLAVVDTRALPVIKHAFTHFDYLLSPTLLRTRALPAAAIAEPDARAWFTIADPDAWPAMPAPIEKLLRGLAASPNPENDPWHAWFTASS